MFPISHQKTNTSFIVPVVLHTWIPYLIDEKMSCHVCSVADTLPAKVDPYVRRKLTGLEMVDKLNHTMEQNLSERSVLVGEWHP
mmetsp:Transcript_136218/g.236297  ORF Transcript_136218/g.236297 Transcript_136218/m.236297 type:complete len:84 (-) Transcript_136218:277-528(-)